MDKVLIMQIFLLFGSVSFSYAGIVLSTDIPVGSESQSYEDRDIVYHEPSFFRLYLSGQSLAISEGVNIVASDFYGNGILFSVDVPLILAGKPFTERDIIFYEDNNFSKIFNGTDVGIPEGVQIDAVTALPDGKIIFSLDIPVSIGQLNFMPTDLILYDGFSVDLYLNGIEIGLPESANLCGVWANPEGSLLFSLDIPTIINGLSVTDRDFIQWNGSFFSLPFADITQNLPQGANVDALAVPYGCHWDADNDGDVDGTDLVTNLANTQDLDIEALAINFGRTNCPK